MVPRDAMRCEEVVIENNDNDNNRVFVLDCFGVVMDGVCVICQGGNWRDDSFSTALEIVF